MLFLRSSIVLAILMLGATAWTSRADAAPRLDPEVIKAALRTAAPEEDGFIERVVGMTEHGVLPRSMVESTFLWARKKPKHKFQYFRQAMVVQAAKIGVRL